MFGFKPLHLLISVGALVGLISASVGAFKFWEYNHDRKVRTALREQITKSTDKEISNDKQAISKANSSLGNGSIIDRMFKTDTSSNNGQDPSNTNTENSPNANAEEPNLSGDQTYSRSRIEKELPFYLLREQDIQDQYNLTDLLYSPVEESINSDNPCAGIKDCTPN